MSINIFFQLIAQLILIYCTVQPSTLDLENSLAQVLNHFFSFAKKKKKNQNYRTYLIASLEYQETVKSPQNCYLYIL